MYALQHCWHLWLKDLCAVIWVSHIFWCLLENDGELLLACRRAVPGCGRPCAAGCGWGGWWSCPRAGTSRPSSLDANREPFSSRGLRCSSPTSVFPFVVDFSLLSVFLAMLSRFCPPLSLSSFLPRWAWCSSLAVAIEITTLSLPLLFSPSAKGAPAPL